MKNRNNTEEKKKLGADRENLMILLASALHPRQAKALCPPVNWQRILDEARRQNLMALVYEEAVRRGEMDDFPGREVYERETVGTVFGQMERSRVFLELYEGLAREGLRPIVMKGICCRQLYGSYRDHRPSGDEDLLIKKEEFPAVKRVLEQRGFRAEQEETTEEQLEQLQEVTFEGGEPSLHLEVHLNPMGKENHQRREMNRWFEPVFERTGAMEIDGVPLRVMNHTDHFLYLLLHTFRHFCSGGFGLRQAMDILLYQEAYEGEMDWNYLESAFTQLGLEGFFGDLIWIGNQMLGFSLKERQTRCPEELLEDMMRTGIFGNDTQEQRTAGQMTMAAVSGAGIGRRGKLRLLFRTAFPEKARMIDLHPELVEKGWLLPVWWIQRWGRFLKHNQERGGGLAAESIRISRHRQKLLKSYGVLH